MRFLRFDDLRLQREFIAKLVTAGIEPVVNASGAVHFGGSEANRVLDAAHSVHDAQFPWYYLRGRDVAQTTELSLLLARQRMRFHVLHSESGAWIVVPRDDEVRHRRLFAEL